MSRSRYYSNQFASFQGDAQSIKNGYYNQNGGNFLSGLKDVFNTLAPTILDIGKQVSIHHLTKGGSNGSESMFKANNNINGNRDRFSQKDIKNIRTGGSFGNASLQSGNMPSTSHSRDLRGRGNTDSVQKILTASGYKYKK